MIPSKPYVVMEAVRMISCKPYLPWQPQHAFTAGDGIAFQKAPMHFTVMPSMNVPNSREWLLPAIGVGLFGGKWLGGCWNGVKGDGVVVCGGGLQLLSEVIGGSVSGWFFGGISWGLNLTFNFDGQGSPSNDFFQNYFHKFRDFWRGGNCVKTLVFPCYITLPTAFESLLAVVLHLHNQGVPHTVDKNKLKLIGTVSSCNLTTAG